MNQVVYDSKAMDYRKIFLVDEAGVKDVALASKYESDEASWREQQVKETVAAFSDVDANRSNSATLDKIDALGEKMFTRVQRAVKLYNPVPSFFNVVSGEIGKTLEASEVVGGRVYGYSYGGIRTVSPLKTNTYTITTAPEAVHFTVPVEQMKVGRYTMADLVLAASQSIIRHKIGLAFGAADTAWASGGSYASNMGSATLTSTVLDAALKTVGAQNVGSMTIVGTFNKLFATNTFVGASVLGYSDKEKENINMHGVPQFYKGASILALKLNPDEVYGGEAFTTTNVYIFSDQKNWNRFVEVGGLTRKTWIDLSTGTFHFVVEFEDGAAIWKPQYGHRIYSVA